MGNQIQRLGGGCRQKGSRLNIMGVIDKAVKVRLYSEGGDG